MTEYGLLRKQTAEIERLKLRPAAESRQAEPELQSRE